MARNGINFTNEWLFNVKGSAKLSNMKRVAKLDCQVDSTHMLTSNESLSFKQEFCTKSFYLYFTSCFFFVDYKRSCFFPIAVYFISISWAV